MNVKWKLLTSTILNGKKRERHSFHIHFFLFSFSVTTQQQLQREGIDCKLRIIGEWT